MEKNAFTLCLKMMQFIGVFYGNCDVSKTNPSANKFPSVDHVRSENNSPTAKKWFEFAWFGFIILLYLLSLVYFAVESDSGDDFNNLTDIINNSAWAISYAFIVTLFFMNRYEMKTLIEETEKLIRDPVLKKNFWDLLICFILGYVLFIYGLVEFFRNQRVVSLFLPITYTVALNHSMILDYILIFWQCLFSKIICAELIDLARKSEDAMASYYGLRVGIETDTLENSRERAQFDVPVLPSKSILVTSQNINQLTPSEIMINLQRKVTHLDNIVEKFNAIVGLPYLIWLLHSSILVAFSIYFFVDDLILKNSDYMDSILMSLWRSAMMIQFASFVDNISSLVSVHCFYAG